MGITRRTFLSALGGLAAAAAGTRLAGCAGPEPSSAVFRAPEAAAADATVISFLGHVGDYFDVAVVEEVVGRYMDERPDVLISYEEVDGDLYQAALERRIATGNLDDVFMLDFEHAAALDVAGVVADLSHLPILDEYGVFVLRAVTNDLGQVHVVPTRYAPVGLFANTALLEGAGLEVPETLSEFERACGAFRQRAMVPVEGDLGSWGRGFVLGVAFWDLYQEDGFARHLRALGEDPGPLADLLLPGFELLQAGWERGDLRLLTTSFKDDGWLDESAFAAGEVPFLVANSWVSTTLAAARPDLSYSVCQLPLREDGTVSVATVDACMAVNAHSEHLDEALDFLSFLLRPETMVRYCASTSCYAPIEDWQPNGDEHLGSFNSKTMKGNPVFGVSLYLGSSFDDALLDGTRAVFAGADASAAVEEFMARVEVEP